jgi:hypothetical protein
MVAKSSLEFTNMPAGCRASHSCTNSSRKIYSRHYLEDQWPQGWQSAKPFLQSSELGLPQPLTRTRVCPPPFGSGGRGTLAGERGVGESQFQRGDMHCGTLCIYVLCELKENILQKLSGRQNTIHAEASLPNT